MHPIALAILRSVGIRLGNEVFSHEIAGFKDEAKLRLFLLNNDHWRAVSRSLAAYKDILYQMASLKSQCGDNCCPELSHSCSCTKEYDDKLIGAEVKFKEYLDAKGQQFDEIIVDVRNWVLVEYYREMFVTLIVFFVCRAFLALCHIFFLRVTVEAI